MSARTDDEPLDPSRPRDVLVVGAGLAATQTVAALRERGFDGRVVVLGTEGIAPYDRPPLSKHLLDRTAPTWLTDEIGVDLLALADEVHLSTPARALSLSGVRPEVLTDDGPMSADALVVATGAHAVRPPGWEAALTLHTAADADRLRTALQPGTRLVVIGAGWIGAEVAGVAAAAGIEVVVVEATGAPLAAALGQVVGELTTSWYASAGVRLLTGEHVVEVGANGVSLADGKLIEADVVLAAVGARPTTDWLAGALPREDDGSLRVDEHLAVIGAPRTVRAVGDVALRRSPRHGWIPGGHWDGALRGPAGLVADLLGTPDDTPADGAPYVFSTQLGHELALFGHPRTQDEVVLRGDPAGAGWAALWYRRGSDEVGAILTVDRPRDVGAARRLFTGAGLPRLDRTLARDPGRPLREAALA
ncbi:NAD(P)/FAD-dependent oxidoreductase [Cellulomonas sp. Root137]|uniref:NAD(P)/FAD-dependent oxidoreductase n=1 Tax=Cellulomonas sp. Root137 TaxID=1736459 RepID=UPI0006FBCC19|nr:FAD-dependent oxidoreductase [Cellulomonas sp. Root137]KQY47349.1 pyridine nucleotide-disulfide oxidoreductase [Cellulomonas sp. Root137]